MDYFVTQRFLAETPLWITNGLVLFFGTVLGPIYLIGWRVNGFPFCASVSGQMGDLLLSVIVTIAITALQRFPILPSGVTSPFFHVSILAIAVFLAWSLLKFPNPWAHMTGSGKISSDDLYHSLIIVPLFFYLLLGIALPVLWCAGKPYEQLVACILIAIYAGMVVYDFQTGKMDQRAYAKKILGITFPLPRR